MTSSYTTALRRLRDLGVTPVDEDLRKLVTELQSCELFDSTIAALCNDTSTRNGTRAERFRSLGQRGLDRLLKESQSEEDEVDVVSDVVTTAVEGKRKAQARSLLPTPSSSFEQLRTPPAKRMKLDGQLTASPTSLPSPAQSLASPIDARRTPFGKPTAQDDFIVAPAGNAQASFNSKLDRLPWMATFSLYHLLTTDPRVTWSILNLSYFQNLQKTEKPVRAGLALVQRIVRDLAPMSPFAESDAAMETLIRESERELATFADTAAVNRGEGRSLGCFEEGPDNDGWFGGKVKYEGKIYANEVRNGEDLVIKLNAVTLGQSCHFSRRFGSDCVLRLRLVSDRPNNRYPSDLMLEQLHELCKRRIVIAGRAFRLVYDNDGVLYFAAIHSNSKSQAFTARFQHPELASLRSLCEWWGNPCRNGGQKVVKWAARLHLLFSPTIPVAKLDHVQATEDIIAAPFTADSAPSHAIMTDGVSVISCSVVKQAQRVLDVLIPPAGIQARIFGSKGVWVMHPGLEFDDASWIGVRPSQRKIILSSSTCDASWRILNVVRTAKISAPASLSYQLLPLLTHGGVTSELLLRIQQDMLTEVGVALMDWALKPNETTATQARRLVGAIISTGLIGGRLRRQAGAMARARGLTSFDEDELTEAEETDEKRHDGYGSDMSNPSAPSTAIARDKFSGQPNSLGETALEMLAAGFLPEENPYLAAKLFNIAKSNLEGRVHGSKRFNIPIEQSASAMCVVDELGVLEEDEISFCFSEPMKDEYQLPFTEVVGDVLLIRSPAYLPSDIIRVRAVHNVKLRAYKNLVVFSSKGSRSTASRLSGGDYDGDRVSVIWHQDLVDSFTNAHISYCDPPFELNRIFDANKKTVNELYDELRQLDHAAAESKLLEVFTAPLLVKSLTGDYSKFHFARAWRYGVDDPKAIELAHKAALCLDSGKSGLQLKPAIVSMDRRAADMLGEPKIYAVIKDKVSISGGRTCSRPADAPRHVLDLVDTAADRFVSRRVAEFNQLRQEVRNRYDYVEDEDLTRRWRQREADLRAGGDEQADLELIRADLQAMLKIQVSASQRDARERDRRAGLPLGSPIKSPRKPSSDSRSNSGSSLKVGSGSEKLKQRDIARAYSEAVLSLRSRFASRVFQIMSSTDLELLRASGAYSLSFKAGHGRSFAYDVAFKDLCRLKAEVKGSPNVRYVVEDVWSCLKSDKRFNI